MVRRTTTYHDVGKGEGDALAFTSRTLASSSVRLGADASRSFRGCTSAVTKASGGISVPGHFLQLVALTGCLAAVASFFGKLACDFGPRAPLQGLSNHLAHLLLPFHSTENVIVLVGSSEGCGSVAFDVKPVGFGALFQTTWRVLRLLSADPCTNSGSSGDRAGASAAAILSFCCLVLLARVYIFGCMLACNALMLQCHVKCLVAAPSAGSSSVAVFAANFLCSVALSWLLLEEQLTFQFVAGAVCMLLGVALLSLSKNQRTTGVLEVQKRQ